MGETRYMLGVIWDVNALNRWVWRALIMDIYLSLHLIYFLVYIHLHPYWVFMTHEVLPCVVDVVSPDGSRDDVGGRGERWQWRGG